MSDEKETTITQAVADPHIMGLARILHEADTAAFREEFGDARPIASFDDLTPKGQSVAYSRAAEIVKRAPEILPLVRVGYFLLHKRMPEEPTGIVEMDAETGRPMRIVKGN